MTSFKKFCTPQMRDCILAGVQKAHVFHAVVKETRAFGTAAKKGRVTALPIS